jgi:hypothetical protein
MALVDLQGNQVMRLTDRNRLDALLPESGRERRVRRSRVGRGVIFPRTESRKNLHTPDPTSGGVIKPTLLVLVGDMCE